jgi:hypothetical protein
MKPRLEAAPWTTEDDQILWRRTLRVGKREQTWYQAFDCRPQDRRDADLMLKAQSDRTASLVLIDPYNMGRSYAAVDVRGKGDGWCPL